MHQEWHHTRYQPYKCSHSQLTLAVSCLPANILSIINEIGSSQHESHHASPTFLGQLAWSLTWNCSRTVHVSGAIIWTVVEANVIMIAACAPTLHPVYDRVRKKILKTYSRHNGTPVRPPARSHMTESGHQRGSDVHREAYNRNPRNFDKAPGFWTAVMALNSMKSSILTTQRTEQTRTTQAEITAPASSAEDEWEERDSPTAAVPMRTLEDAVDWDSQRVGVESRMESGVDKAQLKLYHALQSGE